MYDSNIPSGNAYRSPIGLLERQYNPGSRVCNNKFQKKSKIFFPRNRRASLRIRVAVLSRQR
jgi:hypothetical protein